MIVTKRKTLAQNKTKRSVESNQAVSKLDYEITYDYTLKKISNDCILFENKTYSKFSYIPKSSGYNFGSDQSLDSMYGLASKKSLEVFVNNINDWEAVAKVHGERFKNINPANTLVESKLVGDGYKVEIEAEAVLD